LLKGGVQLWELKPLAGSMKEAGPKDPGASDRASSVRRAQPA
jgi:hypothetical protein